MHYTDAALATTLAGADIESGVHSRQITPPRNNQSGNARVSKTARDHRSGISQAVLWSSALQRKGQGVGKS